MHSTFDPDPFPSSCVHPQLLSCLQAAASKMEGSQIPIYRNSHVIIWLGYQLLHGFDQPGNILQAQRIHDMPEYCGEASIPK